MHDPRWDTLSEADWDRFARCWVAELTGETTDSLPALPVLFEDDPPTTASDFVVPMNFTASAEAQWKFVSAVYEHADDEALGHLAAGPVEHILSNHGADYIEHFELMAKEHTRFARMLGLCHKHTMTDDVWERICAARIAEP
jgi:hypothetical protein